MNMSFRRLSTVLIVAPLFACGGAPPPPRANSTPPPKCRSYAAGTTLTTTFNSPGGPSGSTETDSCAFDTAGHALRCTTTSNNGTCSVVTTYASVTDFVEEAGALGRYRRLTIDTTCGASESTEIFTYDGQKRLTRDQRPPSTYDDVHGLGCV